MCASSCSASTKDHPRQRTFTVLNDRVGTETRATSPKARTVIPLAAVTSAQPRHALKQEDASAKAVAQSAAIPLPEPPQSCAAASSRSPRSFSLSPDKGVQIADDSLLQATAAVAQVLQQPTSPLSPPQEHWSLLPPLLLLLQEPTIVEPPLPPCVTRCPHCTAAPLSAQHYVQSPRAVVCVPPLPHRYSQRVYGHCHGPQAPCGASRGVWPPLQPFFGPSRICVPCASDHSHILLCSLCARCCACS